MGMVAAGMASTLTSVVYAAIAASMPPMANSLTAAVATVASAFFAREGVYNFRDYESEYQRRKLLLQAALSFSELYKTHLPHYAQAELSTIDAALDYLNSQRCRAMEEFEVAHAAGTAQEEGQNPFLISPTPNKPEHEKLKQQLPFLKKFYLQQHPCYLEDEALYAQLREYYNPKFIEQSKNLHPGPDARAWFFQNIKLVVIDLKKEAEAVQRVLRLNEAHKAAATALRASGCFYIAVSAACGISAVVSAARSQFARCFQRPTRRAD